MEYSITRESWDWTSSAGEASYRRVDEKLEIDTDLLELVTLLRTRIGMIMEDTSPVALSTSAEGMQLRLQQIAAASLTVNALVGAAQALLRE